MLCLQPFCVGSCFTIKSKKTKKKIQHCEVLCHLHDENTPLANLLESCGREEDTFQMTQTQRVRKNKHFRYKRILSHILSYKDGVRAPVYISCVYILFQRHVGSIYLQT